MKFRTEIESGNSPHKIGLKTGIVTIGSCFSDVLGSYLVSNKSDCLSNPFGTVYNLVSIQNLIVNALEEKNIDESLVTIHSGQFFHYFYHSSFGEKDVQGLQQKIKLAEQEAAQKLKSADYLVITLGTAWVYVLKDSATIVSNCHKQPADHFEKRLLSLEEQKAAFRNIRSILKKSNPELRFILTVSPVRHIKDSIKLNAASKSALRWLSHELEDDFDDVDYFPSFEIMMDDLRDYRFYKSDLIHPNEMAEEYILQHFSETYFDKELKDFIAEWSKIKASLMHKPFNPEGEAHQKLLKKILAKIKNLAETVNLEEEINDLNQRIIHQG
jgi:lysophospholipase L1-like esterase